MSSDEDTQEQIRAFTGVPVFGLDAISSAAYGPEAALTVLVPLGLAGVRYIGPISLATVVLLESERRELKSVNLVNLSQTGLCLDAVEMLPQGAVLELNFGFLRAIPSFVSPEPWYVRMYQAVEESSSIS